MKVLHHRSDAGAALIAVLWLVVLLTLLATGIATSSVSHKRAAVRLADAVRLDTVADSAIRVAFLHLIAPKTPEDRGNVEGTRELSLLETSVVLAVSRESSRTDINTATEDALLAALMKHVSDESLARHLAARIADWKDPDDEVREGGAERNEYSSAGLLYAPRNGPFESVSELSQVPGFERFPKALFDELTVYTHALEPLANPASSQEPSPILGSELVRVHACAKRGAFERCRRAIVRLTENPRKPFQVFLWQ